MTPDLTGSNPIGALYNNVNSRFERYDGVTSMDQIGRGFVLNHIQRLVNYKRYQDWYDNKFKTLFPAKQTLTNGLALFDFEDLKILPLFAISSKYYQDAILARRPIMQVTVDHPPLTEWLDEMRRAIFTALDEALEHWSITGRGVLATGPNRIRAVDSAEWIPVQHPEDKDLLIGHVLIHPWRDRNAGDTLPDTKSIFNRINLVKWVVGDRASSLETHQFDGSTISSIEGSTRVGDVNGVFTFGSGRGFYPDIAGPAVDIMVHWTLLSRRMHRFSSPPLVVPQGAGGANVTMPNGETLALTGSAGSVLRQALLNGEGPLIEVPTGVDANSFGYVQAEVQISETLAAMEWVGSTIHQSSGISGTAFGDGLGRNMSADAIRQTMLRSGQLISEQRGAIERIFPEAIQAMGAPIPEGVPLHRLISFVWPDDPFTDRDKSIDTGKILYDSDELMPGELRQWAGWPPFTDQQVAEREARQQQMQAVQQAAASNNDEDPEDDDARSEDRRN